MVTVMGGDILPDQGFYGPRKWMIKRILNTADIITSKSIFLDGALNQIGNYAHKIRRVTWGVDTKRFHTGVEVGFLRQRWNIQKDELVFFCPRLCQPIYNKHLNIQAFADYLGRAGPGTNGKLIVAELSADKAYSRQLKGLVAKLGLTEQVCFVGAIPHQEMPAYFNLADIMVSIPQSDGMPQSLYEAMACGTYPILGNLETYRELIQDGVNGRLVKVGNVEALGEAMHWAAEHSEKRKTAAIINRQRVMEVADKDTQDRLVNSIYEELLLNYAK
jgi:glycosyltransferase involved in cell wall biosynthesis